MKKYINTFYYFIIVLIAITTITLVVLVGEDFVKTIDLLTSKYIPTPKFVYFGIRMYVVMIYLFAWFLMWRLDDARKGAIRKHVK